MEEAIFAAWLREDGQKVAAGEPLFALETEKATQEVEAMDSGVLCRAPGGPRPGDRVRVGQSLGHLLAEGEKPPGASSLTLHSSAVADTLPTPPPDEPTKAVPGTGTPVNPPSPTSPAAVRISPRALRVAGELGVAWQALRGTGREGRIRERDVRAAAATRAPTAGPGRRRRIIADRLVAGLRVSAPVTLHVAVDASALVAWRERLKTGAGEGEIPGYTEMLVLLATRALREHPALNARCTPEGEWEVSAGIHFGLAVDTEAGLVVPVVRNAQELDLAALTRRIRELVRRARAGVLTAEECTGGTFTLTNLGAYGIDTFTPIVNPPECGILGVGRIERRPVVVGDSIVARPMVSLSLTFDHRALDGAPAARFLQTLRALIETVRG